MPLEKLTRPRIISALNLLGQMAERERVELELCIYGGSAMMLAYGSREATKDVDATVKPSEVARRLAMEVAQALGLHESWLNDDVKRFVSEAGAFAPMQIEELEAAAKTPLENHEALRKLSAGHEMPGLPVRIARLSRRHRRYPVSDPQDGHSHFAANRRTHRPVLPVRCAHAAGAGGHRRAVVSARKPDAVNTLLVRRPATLQEVAAESRTYANFGHHLRDFLHEFALAKQRRLPLAPLLSGVPVRLAGRFEQGKICDAFLGGYGGLPGTD